MTRPQRTFAALGAAMIAQTIYYYDKLPRMVASHFDGAGHADGWSSRPVFFGVMWGMTVLMALAFIVAPSGLSRSPRGWISLPRKEYWLSDEHRVETFAFLERQLAWYGVATLLLIMAALQFTVEANLSPQPVLSSRFMWVFWACMAFTVVWTVHLITHFVRAPRGGQGTG